VNLDFFIYFWQRMDAKYELTLLKNRLLNKQEAFKDIQSYFRFDIKELQARIRSFEKKHCSELFAGKFWKDQLNSYYYCKRITTNKNIVEDFGEENHALVDVFRIYENDISFNAQHNFYKNSFVSYTCFEIEISREEYEAKLQELTKHLLSLLDLDRKVLFEKCDKEL
jgi:hypothetical protein